MLKTLLLSSFIFPLYLNAQNDILPENVVMDGDTLLLEILDEITLTDLPNFSSYEEKKQYYILKKKVMKVYPYVLIASEKLNSLYEEIDDLSKRRKKRKIIKEREKFLRDNFSKELKRLTRSEGRILVKLIYREQGRTVHSYIRELKSIISAGFWQITAKIYDNNLKAEYHPKKNKEDALIENILIRNGLITY